MRSLILLSLLAFTISALAVDIPYGFAPDSPLKFKRAVRAALSQRPVSENWVEQKQPVSPWVAGPLTFQLVDGGNVSFTFPGGFASTPSTEGDIVRGGLLVSWIYHGSHDTICYNRTVKSTPNIMNLDLTAMVKKMAARWSQ